MEVIVERCAFLDVHRDTVVACARTPDPGGGRREEVAEFGTTTSQLLELADWLTERKVTLVAMEATGIYWKPVHWVLEGSVPEVWVINARHMRNVPGRKTDVADAIWGASLIARVDHVRSGHDRRAHRRRTRHHRARRHGQGLRAKIPQRFKTPWPGGSTSTTSAP